MALQGCTGDITLHTKQDCMCHPINVYTIVDSVSSQHYFLALSTRNGKRKGWEEKPLFRSPPLAYLKLYHR